MKTRQRQNGSRGHPSPARKMASMKDSCGN
jgi:hypothetical protein